MTVTGQLSDDGSVHFKCPQDDCRAPLRIRPKAVRSGVTCKQCGTKFVLEVPDLNQTGPAPAAAPAAPADDFAFDTGGSVVREPAGPKTGRHKAPTSEDRSYSGTSRRPAKSGNGKLIAFGAGGGVILIAGVVGLVIALGGNKSDPPRAKEKEREVAAATTKTKDEPRPKTERTAPKPTEKEREVAAATTKTEDEPRPKTERTAPKPTVVTGTLFVATTGNDANPGTSALPFKTLQKAANVAVAGDVVVVRAGTYVGFNRYGKPSGTATAPIQFLADPGVTANAIPSSGFPNDNHAIINIENSGDYHVIKGFTITDPAGATQKGGIRIVGSVGTKVLNNVVSGAYNCFFASGCDGCIWDGNEGFAPKDEHCLYVAGSRNCIIRNNHFHDGAHRDGIHLNVFTGQLGDGGSGGVTNHLVENNHIHNIDLAGMDIEGVSGCVFQNNLIHDNGKHGFTIHSQDQLGTPQTKNCTFVNNTVLNNNTNITACMQFQTADTAGMVVFNNILINLGNGQSVFLFNASPGTFACDHNVVSDRMSTNGGPSIITLAQWRTATGQDAHSIISSATDLFVNAAGGDYHLKAGVTVPGVATLNGKSAPTEDIVGAARATQRAGAYP